MERTKALAHHCGNDGPSRPLTQRHRAPNGPRSRFGAAVCNMPPASSTQSAAAHSPYTYNRCKPPVAHGWRPMAVICSTTSSFSTPSHQRRTKGHHRPRSLPLRAEASHSTQRSRSEGMEPGDRFRHQRNGPQGRTKAADLGFARSTI